MIDLDSLQDRIKDKLALSEERRRLRANHLQQFMVDFEERHRQFATSADHLVETIIRPALRKLAECFDNADLDSAPSARHHCVCTFRHTDRFPAHAKLELAVTRDGQCQTLLLLYSLEILPVFFPFQHQDQLSFPLDGVDDREAAAWVEKKIIGFVETYLRLETVDQYHADDMVTDPVCGMGINKAHAAANMEYKGQRYYFCLEECRKKFAEEPDHYLAHETAKA